MKAYVISEDKEYILVNNPDSDTTTNSDWIDYLNGFNIFKDQINQKFDDLESDITDKVNSFITQSDNKYVFKAGDTMTGPLVNPSGFVGNADSASRLNPGANINGLHFDGTSNITITHVDHATSADNVGGKTIEEILYSANSIKEMSIQQSGYILFTNGLLINWVRGTNNIDEHYSAWWKWVKSYGNGQCAIAFGLGIWWGGHGGSYQCNGVTSWNASGCNIVGGDNGNSHPAAMGIGILA